MRTISTEERREVAARLRALDYNDLQESLICAYLDALGIKGYADWIGIAHHLADLIEPSDPEGTCGNCRHFIKDRFMPCAAAHGYTEADVSACEDFIPLSCNREALLALADELEEIACWEVQSTGDDNRAWMLKGVCDRIREALGVSDG